MPALDFTCPSCGREIHPNAKACTHCGARTGPERKSWEQDEAYDGLDLPGEGDGDSEGDIDGDNSFDYDEFVEREFGGKEPGGRPAFKPAGISLFWWIVAIVALIAFAMAFVI